MEGPQVADDSSPARSITLLERVELHKGLALWIGILLLPVVAFSAAKIFHKQDGSESPVVGTLDSIAWPRGVPDTTPQRSTTASSSSVAPVESLIAGLATRLEDVPGDAKGWALLAQSYAFLGDTAHAESALAKAVSLGLSETDLRQRVTMARPVETATASMQPRTGPIVHGIVTISGASDLALPADARLFVTAKATNGSPMPVAVLASEVPSFPYSFTLSDAQTMLPGVALSDYEELELSARISRSGTATRTPNDVESDTRVVRLDTTEPIQLVIRAN